MFLVAAAFVSTTVTLKRIGYICLRPKFPKVLFNNLSAWVFPKLPPLEAVARLEVVTINRKKKVWDYNYDDESDSDNEAVPQASAGGYTTHGLTGKLLCPASTSSATLEDCNDSDAEDAQLPEPEAESEPENESQSLVAPEPGPWPSGYTGGAHDRRETQLMDPFSEEDSSSVGSSRDRIFFNVDLNSVCVRVLDDNDSEAPPLFSLPEETVGGLEDPDKTETGLLVASGEGTQPSFPGPPVDCLWPEDASSDKSDTSESDVDIRDGYIMR